MSNKLLFDKLAPLYVIVAAALWGVDSIVLRPSLYSLPVPLVVFIESAIVAIILSPIFIRQSKSIQSLGKKDILAFLGVVPHCLLLPGIPATTAKRQGVNCPVLYGLCASHGSTTGSSS